MKTKAMKVCAVAAGAVWICGCTNAATDEGVLPGAFKYRVEAKVAGEWRTVVDASDNTADLFVDYRETPRTEGVEEIRLVPLAAPKGITPAVYDFAAFGE